MATVSPSPNPALFAANAIPPVSSLNLTPPPQTSTPPQPSTVSPPVPSTQISDQLVADPPNSSPPSAPAPSSSGSETPVTASPNPVDSSPPPTPSTNVSSPPPQTPILPPPPPSDPSPPPSQSSSPPPPQTDPPINSPPSPPVNSPPDSPPPPVVTPPTSSPPPPSSSPPPSSPTPPSSSNPPTNPPPSPPPPSSNPPTNPPPSSNSPPSLPSEPPRRSPPAPTPAAVKPSSPPASGSETYSPPSIPATTTSPPAAADVPPTTSSVPTLPGPQITAQNNHLPSHHSGSSSTSTSSSSSNRGIGSGGAAAIGVVAAVLVIGLVGFIALWVIKRKKRKSGANDAYVIPASVGSSPRSDVKLVVQTEYPSPPYGGGSTPPTDHGGGGFGGSKPWFTYEELSQATDRFSSQNLLGEGGFGCVYKGILADGRVVAVKQLKSGGGQGEREFQAEVEIISRIHHRHLVSLVGYCISDSKRLLVYEYVPNNTLYFHLHGEGRPTMDWATRLKIAEGAARGIAYLHEDCHPRVIHRDIKSSNILIDNNFEARVADFGLARLAMDADTHVSTRVMGTFGYLAPEYATSGKLTEKSDVYSFGVVLLELITGRKPVDESQPLGDESVVEWARPLLSHALETGEYQGLIDPRLEMNYIGSEVFRMIEAAAACVRHSSTRRPRMGQVVRALEGISDSGDLSNGLRVGESQLYDPAQQSAEIRWFRRVAFGGSQGISSDFFDHINSYSSHSQMSQNPGFSRQSRQNGNFSAGSGAFSRPQQHSSVFSHQGSRNLNFSGEDGQRDDLPW